MDHKGTCSEAWILLAKRATYVLFHKALSRRKLGGEFTFGKMISSNPLPQVSFHGTLLTGFARTLSLKK
jgi:hypothetical protein